MTAPKDWKENLRLATPLLLLVVTLLGWSLNRNVDQMDRKIDDTRCIVVNIQQQIFKHMTNDEMHAPRSIVITKPEFMLYQQMRDEQIKDIRDSVYEIKCLISKERGNQ